MTSPALTPESRSQALAHYNAQATIAQLVAALEQLGSMEAFVFSRALEPRRDAELMARIDFARAALASVGAK